MFQKFSTNPVSSEGLEGLRVKCKTCGASATLAGAFNEGEFEKIDEKYPGKYDFTCRGRHPWKHEKCDCGLYPKVLQRGSSSVYFPVTDPNISHIIFRHRFIHNKNNRCSRYPWYFILITFKQFCKKFFPISCFSAKSPAITSC